MLRLAACLAGFAAASAAFLAAPAAMAAPAGCAGAAPLDLVAAVTTKAGDVAHLWGKENLTVRPAEPGSGGPVLRVSYPAGSFSPGHGDVRGGLGFELRRPVRVAACLSYKVRFPVGFDFVKGGKLPGLFGGAAPRGCIAEGKASGFSARLMWRAGGAGELYLYAPGRQQRCGASLGRGSFRFVPGRWTLVTERVSAGAAGDATGRIEVSIDGETVVEAADLTLAGPEGAGIDGLLFSTFFGGDDESWASPADQFVDFADFRLTAGTD
ncbi:hypothetical protein GCM10011390_47860 [Aureimonas endophytica]|uniref:Polysaccharide lyase 14 domain-containing protein n=1 Tax=Aureimonas endophytica TaxID=2027858 RepID=A0A917EC94_9HYPH|nr:hypothetical protein [Aureimonas endophytica]GGE22871.1 hypothetical protein GCM10011390_47860 [Aureimonas endophytica]